MALTSINLSQASYCVHDYNWNCKTCDTDNKLDYIIEEHGEVALMGYNENYNNIFIAFRGSENILNWVDNIQVRKINPYSNNTIKVEKGFYKAYQYLKPDLLNKLKILKKTYNTKNLLITGHSLERLATLLAYDILNNYSELFLNYLITFGSPRIGNKNFVESFSSFNFNHYRITHYYDMVPHIPQEFLHYLHLPNEIWYDETNSKYTICDDSYDSEDERSSLLFKYIIRNKWILLNFNYILNIKLML